MKKRFYLFCLLQISNGYALFPELLATAFAATPVIAPGTYYYCKTKKQMREMQDCTTESSAKMHYDSFRPFVSGVVHGVVPPSNLIHAAIEGPVTLFKNLEHWEKYEGTVLDNDREKARIIGCLSGLSLYVTVPLALRYVRR